MNWELADVQAGFRKAEEPEIKLPISVGLLKKQESSRKKSTFALLTTPKPLTVWITTNWNILKEMWIPDHLTCLLRNLNASQKTTEQIMKQWSGSKLEKEYIKTVYCHPAYLTYMQSSSCEIPDWMKHKLKSRLLGKISITSDMQMKPLLWQKWRGTKEFLDESERGELKSWLKAQHSEN